ncbi:unnamed protein product [Adineta steineri]|uniref:Transmembrane protein n=1 Tax=Adineta steineri TaxID=433720 RepID=A0A815FDY5_9BILA|nr:unnamed protein product [Adineta steineri]CAF1584962.1 unnamed protein product [Adineta steineri]
MGKKTQSIEQKRSSSLPGIVFCTLVIALASVVLQTRNSPPLNEYLSKEISPTKPYETFEEFYPHYLDEHSQQTTRQWHYVAGGLTAYSSIPFFRHLSNGLPEMGLFMMVYIIGGKLITRSFKKTFIPLLLGYSFAWIGHFFFEHNKPATFIYPSFSLMGDFHMVYDAIRSLA